MKQFFIIYDGSLRTTLADLPHFPVDYDMERAVRRLNGEDRFARLIGALPEGLDYDAAMEKDFDVDNWIQVGGSAERLLLQVGRDEGGRDIRLYNVSFEPTLASAPLTERVDHGPGHTMVRPEEIMTWEQALPILVYYVRNDQTIPKGLHLRDFDKPDSASTPS